jgi:5-methylcytosine-specific restriction endonuclease McrA
MCLKPDHRRGGLALHHVIYRSEGGQNTPENLITLCHDCHMEVHSDKRRYQKLLLKVTRLANKGRLVGVLELERNLRNENGKLSP